MAEKTINTYTCHAGHEIVTVRRVKGMTPKTMRCKHPGCNGSSNSADFNVDQKLEPTFEFYKPTEQEMEKLTPLEKDHVNNGGLLCRKIDKHDGK